MILGWMLRRRRGGKISKIIWKGCVVPCSVHGRCTTSGANKNWLLYDISVL